MDIFQDCDELSSNPNITMEIIEQHPYINWQFRYLSLNPNLTLEFVSKNPDLFNFGLISRNKFHKHPFFKKQ